MLARSLATFLNNTKRPNYIDTAGMYVNRLNLDDIDTSAQKSRLNTCPEHNIVIFFEPFAQQRSSIICAYQAFKRYLGAVS